MTYKQSPSPGKIPYLRVGLRNENGQRFFTVHRLVIIAFVGDPPNPKAQTRHLDGNYLNNSWENLAWGTATDNMDDARLHGTLIKGEACNLAKLSSEQATEIIQCYRLYPKRLPRGMAKDMSKKYGVSVERISQIGRGKSGWEDERK